MPQKFSLPLTKPRALILLLARRYGVLGFDLSHLELQKLAYFLQEFGQPDLKLNFIKGTYGPYASNLKHLLVYLEGHYLAGTIQFQDTRPTDVLQLRADKMPEVDQFAAHSFSEEEADRIEKVTHLIEGFESPFGLELLATVHWAMREANSKEISKVLPYIASWSERKRVAMQPNFVALAMDRINLYFN